MGTYDQPTGTVSPYAGTTSPSQGTCDAHLGPAVPSHAARGQALTHAAACRQIWRTHHQHSTRWLRRELAVHQFHLSDYCRPYRSDNLRNVSTWYVRLITTELRRRGASASLTRQGAQS